MSQMSKDSSLIDWMIDWLGYLGDQSTWSGQRWSGHSSPNQTTRKMKETKTMPARRTNGIKGGNGCHKPARTNQWNDIPSSRISMFLLPALVDWSARPLCYTCTAPLCWQRRMRVSGDETPSVLLRSGAILWWEGRIAWRDGGGGWGDQPVWGVNGMKMKGIIM